MKNKPKIIFFGTPHFAEIILEKLISAGYAPVLVVTAPDKPVGRKQLLTPSPVKELAEKKDIPVFQAENTKNLALGLMQQEADLFVVAAYGKILPEEILNIPKHGALNVHPSLLPKYRGSSPVQNAILNGDEKTGTTIMLMDEKMDHGPILASREYPNSKTQETNKSQIPVSKIATPELTSALAEQGTELLIEVIPKWLAGKIKPAEQEHEKATYTKIITRDDGRIDWSNSAKQTERQLRAFTPWPGIFTFLNDKRLKILSLRVERGAIPRATPGKIIEHENGFAIQTSKGVLIPDKVQLEGKKPISAKEFLNGHPDILGKSLV